ncbi:MAG TPA: TRAP transporter large permease [Limnochordales bacterium]
MTLVFPLGLMLACLALGVPVAFSFVIAGAVGLYMILGYEPMLGILQTTPFRSVASFLLSTVPMYVLMAEFLSRGRLIQDIFRSAYYWLGHLKGGLAVATIMANGGLAALSGSSTASAATMATIAVPEMRRYGYSDRLSLGVVAAAGSFAIMIPPSVGLILYGIITETSIGKLFVAGIVPGLLTIVAYWLVVYFWVRRSPHIAPQVPPFPWRKRVESLRAIWPATLLAAVVLGGIYSGIVTPTEAGALGALGALLIGLLAGGLRWRGIVESLERTTRNTAMIYAIVIGATIFGYFLSVTQVTQRLIAYIGSLDVSPYGVLLTIIGLYIVLGTFMEQIAIQFITLPLIFPIIVSLGFDPIWFGIIVIKTAEIGVVTPPVGLNVYVISGALEDASMADTFAGAAVFLIADLAVLALLLLFPELATFLPSLMG